MAQVELLMVLAEHAPAKIGQLATLQRLAPNTVSGLVQQLVEAGLASRDTDPADRRVARVTLTEAGHRQLDEWRAAHERRIGSALDRLPPQDRDAIMSALPGLGLLVEQLTKPSDPPAAK
jgi:DNA-binding MarR family transcriptional regulator